MRRYAYVGPRHIRDRVTTCSGTLIDCATTLQEWLHEHDADRRKDGLIPATFIVDLNGRCWLASRWSEHVACANGADVLAAGEMFFTPQGEVVEVSNQSTGYCPEPESWPMVAAALDSLGVVRPDEFTLGIVFRRCAACGQRNIVKEQHFICAVCGVALSLTWNFTAEDQPK